MTFGRPTLLRSSILAASLALAACGGPLTYTTPGSALATGADAKIVADVDASKTQTKLEIEVTNLPPPSRVSDGAVAYVLWQRASSSVPWARVGTLDYDEGARRGRFEGTVPEVAFDLQVAAESETATASPSGKTVLAQRVQK